MVGNGQPGRVQRLEQIENLVILLGILCSGIPCTSMQHSAVPDISVPTLLCSLRKAAQAAGCEHAHGHVETCNLDEDEKRDAAIEWEKPPSTTDVEDVVRTGDEKVLEAPHDEPEGQHHDKDK